MVDVVCCLVAKSVMTLVIPWTVACRAPLSMGFPRQEYWRHKRNRFSPRVGKIPWNRKWQPALVFLPGKSVDRGNWGATVHGGTKSQTRLSMHRDRPRISCLDSFTTEHQRSPVDVRHASKITPSTIGPSAKDSEGIKEMGFFPFLLLCG